MRKDILLKSGAVSSARRLAAPQRLPSIPPLAPERKTGEPDLAGLAGDNGHKSYDGEKASFGDRANLRVRAAVPLDPSFPSVSFRRPLPSPSSASSIPRRSRLPPVYTNGRRFISAQHLRRRPHLRQTRHAPEPTLHQGAGPASRGLRRTAVTFRLAFSEPFWYSSNRRPCRPARPRTQDFHSWNEGSNPSGVTIQTAWRTIPSVCLPTISTHRERVTNTVLRLPERAAGHATGDGSNDFAGLGVWSSHRQSHHLPS